MSETIFSLNQSLTGVRGLALRPPGPEHQGRLRPPRDQHPEEGSRRRVGGVPQAPAYVQGVDGGDSVHVPQAAEEPGRSRGEALRTGGPEDRVQERSRRRGRVYCFAGQSTGNSMFSHILSCFFCKSSSTVSSNSQIGQFVVKLIHRLEMQRQ